MDYRKILPIKILQTTGNNLQEHDQFVSTIGTEKAATI